MFEPELVAEADRQFAVCNACRYCEGFCAVFGAAELRTAIGSGEVAYLANLCHDCRMCYDACAFSPPHDYGVNIPQVLAQARTETYAAYGRPAAFGAAFRRPRLAAIVAVLAGIGLAAVAALGTPHDGTGAFYRVVPYLAMVLPALALTLYGIVVLVAGGRRFAADIRTEAPGNEGPRPLAQALHDVFSLAYLRGGGGGCYDESRGSQRRRLWHMFVFWGVLADLAATIGAFVEQDVLGVLPPYPLASVPVALGALGGLAIVAGVIGLWAVKRRSDERPASPPMIALDEAFLGMLLAVALTGLALLAFRTTEAMPALLVGHLGTVFGLFVTAPYGKFVHAVYRTIALVQHASERAPSAQR